MTNLEATGQPELISVICRSIGRPQLKAAIDSVSSQTYPNIELVLVCASGEDLSVQADQVKPANLTVVNEGKPLPRSVAANAGLTNASGDYLIFLDDDDWFAPEHLEKLHACLRDNSNCNAAYSSVQKSTANGEPGDYVFATDYDPLLLLRDNYIPIHAMLFSRSLLDHGCRFDEAMDIYEDWDFWLQLNQHTEFVHVDAITAFYRDGGDSETAATDVASRYNNDNKLGQARSYLFNKWLPTLTGEKFNALLGHLDQSATIAELSNNVDAEHAANLAHQQQIKELHEQLETLTHEANLARAELQNTRDNLTAQIATLEKQLHDLYNSTSWKLTGPLRKASRALRSPSSTSPSTDEQEHK